MYGNGSMSPLKKCSACQKCLITIKGKDRHMLPCMNPEHTAQLVFSATRRPVHGCPSQSAKQSLVSHEPQHLHSDSSQPCLSSIQLKCAHHLPVFLKTRAWQRPEAYVKDAQFASPKIWPCQALVSWQRHLYSSFFEYLSLLRSLACTTSL